MSKHRENVIWQSADGTWNRAFFRVIDGPGYGSDDYDDEWDVDYDFGVFTWVSTGHATEEAAERSWNGANPGGSNLYTHTPDHAEQCAHYDAMAVSFREEQRRLAASQPRRRLAW